jgi:hypothetical protein
LNRLAGMVHPRAGVDYFLEPSVAQPPLPLQEFLPLQPLSLELQPPLPLQEFKPLQACFSTLSGAAWPTMGLMAEFAEVAARATVPPSRPVKAAVSTTELFETFITLLSFMRFFFLRGVNSSLAGPATAADPLHHLEDAPDDAERDESQHDPGGLGCSGDPQDVAPVSDRQQADNRKSNGARYKDPAEEPPAWIGKGACARDDEGEGKWRRGQAGQTNGDGSAVGHASLEIFEAPGLHHSLKSLFTALAAYGIQKKNSDRGANGRGQDKEWQARGISGDEEDNQEIVSKRKEEKRRICDAKQQRSKDTEFQQPGKEMAYHAVQTSLRPLMTVLKKAPETDSLTARLTVADEQNQRNMSRDREGAEAEPSFNTDS